MVLAVGLAVLGLRLAVLQYYSEALPYVDEWEATAPKVLSAWREHRFHTGDLFALHNDEHRIVVSRLWEIFWFQVNAAWDPQLVMTADACIAALCSGVIAFCLPASGALWKQVTWLAGLVLLTGMPFGYANALWGFQSQFFFYSAFGLGSIVMLLHHRGNLPGITAGALLLAAAQFTNGGGLLVAVAVGFVAVIMALKSNGSGSRRRWLAVLGLTGGIFALGWLLRGHTGSPSSPWETMQTVLKTSAWPTSNLFLMLTGWPDSQRYLPAFIAEFPRGDAPWVRTFSFWCREHKAVTTSLFAVVGGISYAPFMVALIRWLRRGPACLRHGELVCMGLGIWSVLNIAAIAIARAGDSFVPGRYLDMLVLGLLVNLWFVLHYFPNREDTYKVSYPGRMRSAAVLVRPPIGHERQEPREDGGAPCVFGWLWLVIVTVSLAVTLAGNFVAQLPRKLSESRAGLIHLRQYYLTGEPQALANVPLGQLPILGTDPSVLIRDLDDLAIRAILPLALRSTPPPAPMFSSLAALMRSMWAGFLVAALILGLPFTRYGVVAGLKR